MIVKLVVKLIVKACLVMSYFQKDRRYWGTVTLRCMLELCVPVCLNIAVVMILAENCGEKILPFVFYVFCDWYFSVSASPRLD